MATKSFAAMRSPKPALLNSFFVLLKMLALLLHRKSAKYTVLILFLHCIDPREIAVSAASAGSINQTAPAAGWSSALQRRHPAGYFPWRSLTRRDFSLQMRDFPSSPLIFMMIAMLL